MSLEILATKPYGYDFLDDASELCFKGIKNYDQIFENTNFKIKFCDLKDLENYLLSESHDFGVILAEVPAKTTNQRITALANYIKKALRHFPPKQLILITTPEGLDNDELVETFARYGSFAYVKPIIDHQSFIDTITNTYEIYGKNKNTKYFSIGPVSDKFEKYFIKEFFDDEKKVPYLKHEGFYDLSNFYLGVKDQELFTSKERYFFIYTKPENFTAVNIELLQVKLLFEENHNEKVNIHVLAKNIT